MRAGIVRRGFPAGLAQVAGGASEPYFGSCGHVSMEIAAVSNASSPAPVRRRRWPFVPPGGARGKDLLIPCPSWNFPISTDSAVLRRTAANMPFTSNPARQPRALDERNGGSGIRHYGQRERAWVYLDGNSQPNRLTPWNNDPVTDPHPEAIYIRDDKCGAVGRRQPARARDGRVSRTARPRLYGL